jgi:hypothetical protein
MNFVEKKLIKKGMWKGTVGNKKAPKCKEQIFAVSPTLSQLLLLFIPWLVILFL